MVKVYKAHYINPLFRLIGYGIMSYRSLTFPTKLKGEKSLRDIVETGGKLWVNHQAGEDILAIGRVLRQVGAGYGWFVMKDTLKPQWLLTRSQGLPVMRERDYITGDMDPETVKAIRARIEAHNNTVYRTIAELTSNGKVVTSFPQITRHEGLEAAVKGNFAPLLAAQRHLRMQGNDYKIPSAPVRITYAPREPLKDPDNPVTDVLVEVFKPEILGPREVHAYWQ